MESLPLPIPGGPEGVLSPLMATTFFSGGVGCCFMSSATFGTLFLADLIKKTILKVMYWKHQKSFNITRKNTKSDAVPKAIIHKMISSFIF
jgi:hypothetical protein